MIQHELFEVSSIITVLYQITILTHSPKDIQHVFLQVENLGSYLIHTNRKCLKSFVIMWSGPEQFCNNTFHFC